MKSENNVVAAECRKGIARAYDQLDAMSGTYAGEVPNQTDEVLEQFADALEAVERLEESLVKTHDLPARP